MKLHALMTVTLLLFRLVAAGQQPVTFDTVQFGPVSYAIGYAAFETDDGFTVFSLQKFSTTPYQDITVVQFDEAGGLSAETHVETVAADQIGNCSPVVRIATGYVTGCDRYTPGALDSLFIQYYDAEGVFLSEQFLTADTATTMRGMARTVTGDLLLTGLHQYPEEAYVYHLDSLGNIKGYHGYPGFDGEDVVEGRDGKWYVCGKGNQAPYYNHPVLLRSDTLGQQIWRRSLPDLGNFVSMIPLQDHGVLGLGIIGHHPDSAGFALALKYDSNGTEVWRKELFQTDDDTWPAWFHAGYENQDSSLVLAGWYRSIAMRDQGLLVKVDKNGDTLWHRFYSHYPGAAYEKDQIFWDVKPTSDGGMVLTGETNSDDYPYAQLWLLKLDSMGCLVPGCGSVGVQEYTDLFHGKLVVAPNPASERVSLALDLIEGIEVSGQVRAMLLDATGRVVLEHAVQQNLNKLSAVLDVSALSSGTYYLHLRDAKRWLAGSKMIVE